MTKQSCTVQKVMPFHGNQPFFHLVGWKKKDCHLRKVGETLLLETVSRELFQPTSEYDAFSEKKTSFYLNHF